MAHYNVSVETRRPPDEMFAYLSDFSTTKEWDPGVIEAERVGDAPVSQGTEFRLVAEFLGRKTPLTYRIIEHDPPNAVTFRGENSTVISLDRITFEPSDGGTRITYDADLALKGPLKLADPLLGLAFDRVGDRALTGLRNTLGTQQPAKLPTLAARALDGKAYELPGDLRTQYSFVLVAFHREHQALVDTWLPWLLDLEQRRSDVAVYELPVLSTSYSPARWLIDGGMARGIPDASARARTITVYTDVTKAVRELGCPRPTPSRCCSSSAQAGSSPASAAASTTRRPSGSQPHSSLSPNTTARDDRPAQTPSQPERVNVDALSEHRVGPSRRGHGHDNFSCFRTSWKRCASGPPRVCPGQAEGR